MGSLLITSTSTWLFTLYAARDSSKIHTQLELYFKCISSRFILLTSHLTGASSNEPRLLLFKWKSIKFSVSVNKLFHYMRLYLTLSSSSHSYFVFILNGMVLHFCKPLGINNEPSRRCLNSFWKNILANPTTAKNINLSFISVSFCSSSFRFPTFQIRWVLFR